MFKATVRARIAAVLLRNDNHLKINATEESRLFSIIVTQSNLFSDATAQSNSAQQVVWKYNSKK